MILSATIHAARQAGSPQGTGWMMEHGCLPGTLWLAQDGYRPGFSVRNIKPHHSGQASRTCTDFR